MGLVPLEEETCGLARLLSTRCYGEDAMRWQPPEKQGSRLSPDPGHATTLDFLVSRTVEIMFFL